MRKSRIATVLGLVLLVAGFGYGVVYLCLQRLQEGDIYPPYSSLRRDPLGTKALFESLERLSVPVERNVLPLHKIGSGRDSTLMLCGMETLFDQWMIPKDTVDVLERFAAEGGRVVLTALPTSGTLKKKKKGKDEDECPMCRKNPPDAKESKKAKDKKAKDKKTCPACVPKIAVRKQWGFSMERVKIPRVEDVPSEPATATEEPPPSLPPSVSWHSTLCFKDLDPAWRTLYTRRGHPVLIERPFGRGTLVLMSDSYLLSNEALRNERHAGLLYWLVGSGRKVIFDETHLGLTEETGIAALGRRYRLHGLAIGLLLIAGLFVWKSAVSFVPPFEEEELEARRTLMTGRDFFEGFVNLIRKHIPPSAVLGVCRDEWEKARGRRRGPEERTEQVRALVEKESLKDRKEMNAVGAYNEIARTIGRRSRDERRS